MRGFILHSPDEKTYFIPWTKTQKFLDLVPKSCYEELSEKLYSALIDYNVDYQNLNVEISPEEGRLVFYCFYTEKIVTLTELSLLFKLPLSNVKIAYSGWLKSDKSPEVVSGLSKIPLKELLLLAEKFEQVDETKND